MKITKEQRKDIVELYKNGQSMSKIALIYNVGCSCIRTILKNQDTKIIHSHKTNKIQESEIIELYKSGKNIISISKIYNLYVSTVSRILCRYGEKTRGKTKLPEEKIKEMIKLYQGGFSGEKLSQIYKVSPNCILGTLKRHHIQRRLSRTLPRKEFYICNVCKKEKPYREMAKNKNTISGVSGTCRNCTNEQAVLSKYRRFGLTRKIYQEMFQNQDGKCAICKSEIASYDINGKIKRLYVDHSHSTGKVRGLLCNNCNTAIGHLRDSPELLRKAAQYLENHA